MMSKEAMKLALEALENSVDLVREDAYEAEKLYGNYPTRQGKVNGLKVLADDHEKAIEEMRQAIAEAEQQQPKPFCYHDGRNIVGKQFASHSDVFPLYTAPPPRQPLTDEQEREAFEAWAKEDPISWGTLERTKNGAVYRQTTTQCAFEGWQARAAHGIKGEA